MPPRDAAGPFSPPGSPAGPPAGARCDRVVIEPLQAQSIGAGEVIAAIASLTPDHRRVILEVTQRGRSVSEAAAVLGVPEATVKSRLFYALKALALLLQEQGEGRHGGAAPCTGC